MMVRGIRVSQWLKRKSVQNLVRRVFPGTDVRIWNLGGRKYRLEWKGGNASDAGMRALADDIEAALPAKAAAIIKCRRGGW